MGSLHFQQWVATPDGLPVIAGKGRKMRVTFRTRGISMSALLAAGLALAAVAAPARADLLDFTFSFSNGNGSIPGTVTGLIEGLSDNSTGAAHSHRLV